MAGIYLHIPFCRTLCPYCNFYHIILPSDQNDFINAILKEAHLRRDYLGNEKVSTIYIGGGTPTSLNEIQINKLLNQLNKTFDFSKVLEITFEAGRADTITQEKLEVIKKYGIKRISINPQTFTQETLDIIGRHHTVEETLEKFKLARKMGINNINMDLIIGLPSERLPEFKDSLEKIEQLIPETLTIHTMAFKRASFLTQNKKAYQITEQEEIVRMMDYATKWTKKNEYYPYYLYRQKNMLGNLENIGYALEGKESLYNILIMEEKQTILGLGSGAVSKMVTPVTNQIERLPNPKEPRVYIQTIEEVITRKLKALSGTF